jgi:hypothetical protein
LNKLSNAVLAAFVFSISSFFPAVSVRYAELRENQSQKLALSLSATGSAFDSRQSPLAPETKNLQFRQERRSFPHALQRRERPKGSSSVTGEPQYQHMIYITSSHTSLQDESMVK